MSIIKRHMEEVEDKFRVATDIAIRAGVLQQCEYCESTVFQGDEDIEDAYRLGNTLYTSGEVSDLFESRREMTDAIKDTVESGDHAADCCYYCHDKMYGDD
ncbi:hypothetical protein [Photobacterium leiognathi]|uniref:Uncharacterized protein n=1 Tax=Photobacterium leiognathi TaxID=553611 RepID=A0ABX5GE81_PHOLE|nr:hypothetical protein [Photobacterium leiognathi]KJF88409.1 hypothetical protein UB42_16400 [Photobacterium leiognathi]PSV80710.1 hypothetical protein CTM94_13225 [Photobacterium leiognathi]